MQRVFQLLSTLGIITAFVAVDVQAESRFGSVMKKRYELRSVTCYACHVKGKDKEVLNDFGQDVAKTTDGLKLSQRLEAAKSLASEERQAVYRQVDQEFGEALKKLDKLQAPSGKTYAEAIPRGEIEGTKIRQ